MRNQDIKLCRNRPLPECPASFITCALKGTANVSRALFLLPAVALLVTAQPSAHGCEGDVSGYGTSNETWVLPMTAAGDVASHNDLDLVAGVGIEMASSGIFDIRLSGAFEVTTEIFCDVDHFTSGITDYALENELVTLAISECIYHDTGLLLHFAYDETCHALIVSYGDRVGGAFDDLILDVAHVNANNGIVNSLDAKLSTALDAWDDDNEKNDQAACNGLNAFINHVEAQRDKQITSHEADALVSAALDIIDLICPPEGDSMLPEEGEMLEEQEAEFPSAP